MTRPPPPPSLPAPEPETVDLWHWSIDLPAAQLDAFWPTLDRDEQDRALRFHFERDRNRFIAAHGQLRHLLGRYLGRAPSDIRFATGTHGKPRLVGASRPICFNLSHSGNCAVLGVTHGFELGVDVELPRPVEDNLADSCFAPGEVRKLRSLPQPMQNAAFFRCWTRKEAFVKALGQGLSIPLDTFEVSLGPTEPARLLSVAHDPAEAEQWALAHFDLSSGYVGAVAARRRFRLRHRELV